MKGIHNFARLVGQVGRPPACRPFALMLFGAWRVSGLHLASGYAPARSGRSRYRQPPQRSRNSDEATAPVLQAAGDRRAGAIARIAGAARAHDPFRAAPYRQDSREGPRPDPPRWTWCSAISRTPFRPTPRRRRGAISSRWRRPIFRHTGLWTRINALNSPWALDDVVEIVAAVGDKLDVVMLPKVEGVWDIHYLDQLLAQVEAGTASSGRS